MVAGISGAGFTGSYIFSQTIFSMRAGITSRLNGGVVAVAELFIFLLPFSVCPLCAAAAANRHARATKVIMHRCEGRAGEGLQVHRLPKNLIPPCCDAMQGMAYGGFGPRS